MTETSPLPERFWVKTTPADRGFSTPCMVWTACKTPGGYGQFRLDGRCYVAHRLAYERIVGPVGDGLQLDHLCRVRACVNVAHLEPVTQKENLHRGDTVTAANAAKTHCPSGHAYDEANTQVMARGWRRCRSCNRERLSIRNARIRESRSK